jgi:hypothetical protein
MPSDSLPETPAPSDVVASPDGEADDPNAPESRPELPTELSQFNQRLASFGLGETPDPLLTEARPPGKRKPRR